MIDKITCCILNQGDNINSSKLYEQLSKYFNTVIVSYDNDLDTSEQIDQFNLYYSAYKKALDNNSIWLMYISSSVVFDDMSVKQMAERIENEIIDSNSIGTYQASAIKGSYCYGINEITKYNEHLFSDNSDSLRDISKGEDWMLLTRLEFCHSPFAIYKTTNFKSGWGIGWSIMEEAKRKGYRTVIDNRIQVLNHLSKVKSYSEWQNEYEEYIKIFNESVYNFSLRGYNIIFTKNPDDADKYIVITCAKNEDRYLIEFVEHYLNLGFDKIIFADNNDENTTYKVLEEYTASGKVEIINCRHFGGFQVEMYAMFAGYGNYQWCGYFDADEYLELNCYTNVKDFLKNINENSVSFNWINFGSNGEKHYNNKPIQERFKLPVPQIMYFKENCFVKSIVRGGDCWKGCRFNGSHVPYIEGNDDIVYNIGGYYLCNSMTHTHYPFRYKYGYIKHYYTKSFDEWVIKSNRGWPDGTDNLKMSTFFAYEPGNEFDFNRFIYAAFGNDSDYYNNIYENSEFHRDAIDNYSVIEVSNDSKIIYSLVLTIVSMMKCCTDHTFIVTDNTVDDTLYGMLLECAFYTGNRVVFAKNRDEVWRAFLKYNNKNENTYYIIRT